MLKGFKDFLLRGNVVDLAVAVVIGSAFTAIVTAFTTNLINPIIASIGGANVNGLAIQLVDGNDQSIMDFGAVITAAINFLIVAAVVYFILVVPMNKVKELSEKRKKKDAAEEAKEPTTDEKLVALLTDIRDQLNKQQKA